MTNIKAHVDAFNRLREAVARTNDLDIDDQAVIDTADGETDLTEQFRRAVMRAIELEQFADSLYILEQRYYDRRQKLIEAAANLRMVVAEGMLDTGQKTIRLPEFTLTAGHTKPGIELTPAAIPDEYKKDKIVRVPDREHINAAIEIGADIPGVLQHNGRPMLTVR